MLLSAVGNESFSVGAVARLAPEPVADASSTPRTLPFCTTAWRGVAIHRSVPSAAETSLSA